jgi:hypothetical protein
VLLAEDGVLGDDVFCVEGFFVLVELLATREHLTSKDIYVRIFEIKMEGQGDGGGVRLRTYCGKWVMHAVCRLPTVCALF